MARTSRPATTDPSINLSEDLLECLSHLDVAESTNTFALFEPQKNPPNPGIYLRKGGAIGLPLSDGDANVLRAASHLPPPEKILDSSLDRKIWVVPADEFEIKNPAWESFLRNIIEKVSAGLAVDSAGKGVSAELSHLSLYDEGTPSMPGRGFDIEPSNPRTFATLVITLPSKHVGGEVYISHGGTIVFEPAQFSEYDLSYFAWFSDVNCEVKSVLSGRRLFLTYNLVHATLNPDVLAASSNKSMAKLDMLFSYWKKNVEEESSALAYLLKVQLKDGNLSYNELQGQDLQVVDYLQQTGGKYGFCIYLASLKRSVELNEDDDDSFHEREIDQDDAISSLTRVIELDGTEVAKGMDFEDDMLIQDEPFEDVEPDEEEWDHGTTTAVLYFRTVVLIMPKRYRIAYFLTPSFPRSISNYWGITERGVRYEPDVTGWIDRLSSASLSDPDCRGDVEEICKLVTDEMRSWKNNEALGTKPLPPFSDADIARVVAVYVELDNKDMFLESFEMCPFKVLPSTFRSVGAALLRYGLESLLPKLSLHVSVFDHVSDRFHIINEVQQGVATESQLSALVDIPYQQWIREESNKAISDMAVAITSAEDGAVIADYCKQLPVPEIFSRVLPAVMRNIKYTSMTIAFQLAIFNAGNEGSMPLDTARVVFAHVLSGMLNGFGLFALGAYNLPEEAILNFGWNPRLYRPPHPLFDAERSRKISLLLCHCQTLHLATELNLLLSNLAEEAKTINLCWFEFTFFPFLKILGSTIQRTKIPLQPSPFQSLFQQVLSTYVEHYVQLEPQISKDWSRPTVAADCQDCGDLNLFLANPNQQDYILRATAKRRDHIYSKVSDTGIEQCTDKSASSPYSLVLIKNTKYYELAHKAWEHRCTIAKNHLQGIDSEIDLRPFLGDLYDPITSLSMIKSSTARVHNQLSPTASAVNFQQGSNILQPLAPVISNVPRPRQLPGLSSVIAEGGRSRPPLDSRDNTENQTLVQGTKRKASEALERDPKREAPEVVIIND